MSDFEAILDVLKLLDDTEVPEPIPIETEEDRKWLEKYIWWRWVQAPFL